MTKTHNKTNTKIYGIWRGIKQRCHYKNHKFYRSYGGRGITIFSEWEKSFQAFYDWATSHGYKQGLSIDRIDNDGNYCPENCRWVSMKEQSRNRKSTRLITYKGKTLCALDWSKEVGIKVDTLYHRIRIGWTPQQILETKVTPNGK